MLSFDWLKEMFKVKIFIAPVNDGAPEIRKELKWSRLHVISFNNLAGKLEKM